MHLRAAGVSVVLDASGPGVPAVLHWGADLGDAAARRAGPGGRPAAQRGRRRGRRSRCWPAASAPPSTSRRCAAAPPGRRRWRARRRRRRRPTGSRRSPAGPTQAGLDPGDRARRSTTTGVLRVRARAAATAAPRRTRLRPARCRAAGAAGGDRAARPDRPVVPRAAPAAAPLAARAPGRASPGTAAPGTTPRCCWWPARRASATGTARWGVHLAWSGDQTLRGPSGGRTAARCSAAASCSGRARCVLGAGGVLPDARRRSRSGPDDGLDGLSDRLHRHVRARAAHPRRPRPVVLNTWEAVYFDHRLDRLTGLADVAAAVGVERFVLDDGWFLRRRHDRAGLGDWTVDPEVWPDGLGPLIDHVRGLGMEFGLWVEPEMVNAGLRPLPRAPRLGAAGRRRAAAWPGGTSRCSTSRCPRRGSTCSGGSTRCCATTTSPTSSGTTTATWSRPATTAGPAVHGQTLAVYRLLDELRAPAPGRGDRVLRLRRRPGRPRHPGAHRPGLGQRHQRRAGAADHPALDPAAAAARAGRQPRRAGRGAHHRPHPRPVVPRGDRAVRPLRHRVGRHRRWTTRSAAALAGLVATYRRHRALLHSGDVVHADHPDPAAAVHGVVAADGSRGAVRLRRS